MLYHYKAEDGDRRRPGRRRTSATAAGATSRGARPTATSSTSATATARRYLADSWRRRQAVAPAARRRRSGCSRWSSTTASTTRRTHAGRDGAVGQPARRSFSSYRAGFEVRTYRLCQRVLMFHHFPDDPTPGSRKGYDGLVRSTDFTYSYEQDPARPRAIPVYSFLLSVTQTGYQREAGGGYLTASLPPLEFEYTDAPSCRTTLQRGRRREPGEPARRAGRRGYQWVDLRRRRAVRHPDRAGRRLVLQAQPQPDQPGRQRATARARRGEVRAAGAGRDQARPRPRPAARSSWTWPATASPTWCVFDGPTPGFYERDRRTTAGSPSVPFASLPNRRLGATPT